MKVEHAITRKLSDAEFVGHYLETERLIVDALAQLKEAKRRLDSTLDHVMLCDRWQRVNFEDPKDVIEHVRRQVWRHLVERLQIRRMCSIKEWEQLQRQIEEGEVPEVTQETVTQMAVQFVKKLPDMHLAAVKEVFEWLRPWNNKYKTNSQDEVPPKVILEYMVRVKYSGTGFEANYGREQHLTALENVFTAIDGQGFTTKAHYSELSNAIKASTTGRGETRYFVFRAYKNGNLHLQFKRLDLLKKLNQMAGGKRLKKQI